MTNTLSEAKAQRWRIIAVQHNGATVLVYVGSSIAQVRDNYQDSWTNYIHHSVRDTTKKLLIQQWVGAADCGHWHTRGEASMKDRDKVQKTPLAI